MARVFKKCKKCDDVCEMGKTGMWKPIGLFGREVPVCDKCAGVTRDHNNTPWNAEKRANGKVLQSVDGKAERHVRWEDVKA
jgi:ribosome-binding protein aMBF1 (putative translation factor)